MNLKTLSKIGALSISIGLLSGCVSTDEIKQLQTDVAANRTAAAKAQQSADAAVSTANEANVAATEALRKANASMDAANAAQAAADEASERSNRIMRKAMMK